MWRAFVLATWMVWGTVGAGPAQAVDIPVIPKKLIVVDKLTVANRAKVVYVSKDQAAITKGTGTDVSQIDVQFSVAYGNSSAEGGFTLPPGASNGTAYVSTQLANA